jgi:hypothetical protein
MVLQLWDPEANRCLGEYSGIGQSAGALYNPLDMALDGNGRLFISQGYEGRVQVFEVAIPAPSPGASQPSQLRVSPRVFSIAGTAGWIMDR